MPSLSEKIYASPSKSFFIDMITRDLTITDCILDMLDNSVDKAVEIAKVDVMKTLLGKGKVGSLKGKIISLKISKDKFEITDNCGGISIKEAKNTVFRFGNPDDREAWLASMLRSARKRMRRRREGSRLRFQRL